MRRATSALPWDRPIDVYKRQVLDIAGQFGYDNASKFAKAFRDVVGVSPREYRAGAAYDSCAPQPVEGASAC